MKICVVGQVPKWRTSISIPGVRCSIVNKSVIDNRDSAGQRRARSLFVFSEWIYETPI